MNLRLHNVTFKTQNSHIHFSVSAQKLEQFMDAEKVKSEQTLPNYHLRKTTLEPKKDFQNKSTWTSCLSKAAVV